MVGVKLGNKDHLELCGKTITKVHLQHLVDGSVFHFQSTAVLCAEKASYQATAGSKSYRRTGLMNLRIGWSCSSALCRIPRHIMGAIQQQYHEKSQCLLRCLSTKMSFVYHYPYQFMYMRLYENSTYRSIGSQTLVSENDLSHSEKTLP